MRLLVLGSGSYKSPLSFHRPVALAKELGKRGYDVYAVMPSADKYNKYTPEKHARIEGVKLVQPWQPATKNDILNLMPYLFTALLSCLKIRPQLIFISKPTPITIIGLVPKFLFRAPLILDIDDLGSEVMRLEGKSGLQMKLVAFCERFALKYADAVVVASTYLESMVKQQYSDKPVLVLSNGVDPQEQSLPEAEQVRNMIYYFGALNRLNLIETFLRSLPMTLARVPDAAVLILGDGSALGEAKALVQSLDVAGRVTFAGWTLAEDLDEYVRFGDIAVCMQPDIQTVRAASNMKVFQYMRLGSVPVVSDVGDLAAYVKNGQGDEQLGVVVPADDPEALAAALVAALNDKQGRLKMAKKARRAAETDFAMSTLAGKLDMFIRAQFDQKPSRKRGVEHD